MLQGNHKDLSSLKTRKKFKILFLAFLFVGFFLTNSFQSIGNDELWKKIDSRVVTNCESIVKHLDSITINASNSMLQKKHYELARKAFKEIEFYIEYNFPFHSKYFINGPLVNKAEMEFSYKTFVPHGFQVIESYLYSAQIDSNINLAYEITMLKQTIEFVKNKSRSKQFKDYIAVDMIRFELIRIMSLYLNGYDCTINKQNISETRNILNGIKTTIQSIDSENEELTNQMIKADNFLSKNNDYNEFNRLEFIVNYLKPLYEGTYALYGKYPEMEKTTSAINIRDEKFYGSNWLNNNYFSIILKDSLLLKKQIELGSLLFFDPILSGNNQRACASCHQPSKAFANNNQFDLAFNNTDKLLRNTPSLLNSLYQKAFFQDGRSLQIEDQASDVLLNHKEMFSTPEEIVNKLKKSQEYRNLFKQAFINSEDTSITYYAILKSIGEYEKTLISLNSRFDKYLRGDKTQLNIDEIRGYTIFSGKALCGSCHFFPLFNGTVPPFYNDNEYEVIGVPKDSLNETMDLDSGRYLISRNPIHLYSFKTPSIRNIDKSAPYMHNGIYESIDQVIEFYKRGGGSGLKLDIPNQTLPFDSLQLNKTEISNLKKFLLTLTDNQFAPRIPKKLPHVEIKGFEERKVGGNY